MTKVAVVTGCSSGLGKALAIELASQVEKDLKPIHTVYGTARRLEGLEELRSKGIYISQADVTDSKSCSSAFEGIESRNGTIDLLICNAGVAATAPLIEQDIAEVTNVIQTNTLGVLRCIQAVAPGMVKRRKGRIVVVGSITAFLASPFNGAYAASKAAVHSFSETLRMELQPFGVEVLEVWAGTFKTDINAKVSSGVEKYCQPASAYHPIAAEIKERSEILEREPNQMSPQQVASDIVKNVMKRNAPHYIKTGTHVGMYNFLGYLQSFVCPGSINSMLQKKFGLEKLARIVAQPSVGERVS